MVKTVSFRTNSSSTPTYIGSTVADIDSAVERNKEYKKLLWSGKYMQIYGMSIPIGDEIGLEAHNNDQFIKIESGRAKIVLGRDNGELNYERIVDDGDTVLILANTPHNVINVGDEDLKLLSIYAPILQ